MDKSWKIDPWKIHGKSNAKTMGKTMEKSMGNSWEIHGKSLENKKGKKTEMFPWFSMPNKNAHKFLGSKPPKIDSKTGIRFDTKLHHN
jgi:hypothetical protein